MMGSHGMFRKVNPYDEAIRTPMINSGGLATYSGWQRDRKPVLSNSVDIAPTTLGLCHLAKDGGNRSLSLRSPKAGRRIRARFSISSKRHSCWSSRFHQYALSWTDTTQVQNQDHGQGAVSE